MNVSVIGTARWVEQRRRIAAQLRAGQNVSASEIRPFLCEGYDYFSANGPRASEPYGMPRYSHIAILAGVADSDLPGRPMFTARMSAREIEAGIYRQCRILPEPLENGIPMPEDPFSILADEDYDPMRAWLFRVITGHAPRDPALFLAHMMDTRPEIGKLLLAKDFEGALIAAPELLHGVRWPDTVRAGWKATGGEDYLPPIICLAIYAELACLALTDRGMISLSFDENGEFLTTGKLISDLVPQPTLGSNAAVPYQSRSADTLAAMAPFQTFALLPPTVVFEERAQDLGRAWSLEAASFLPSIINEFGPQLVDDLTSLAKYLTPQALQRNVMAHPKCWPEARSGYGYSIQKRSAVEYWGLDRRQSLAVGLLEIARDAQDWNARYKGASALLAKSSTNRRIANAMQMVCCLWLEDANPTAAIHLGEEIREGFRDKRTRQYTIFDDDKIDDICNLEGFGCGLLRNAKQLMKRRARPGEEGYSARRKAHLWLSPQGDDLGFYSDLQAQVVANHLKRRSGHHASGVRSFDGLSSWNCAPHRADRPEGTKCKREQQANSMTTDIEAAYCARDKAMMLSSSSTDPMRSFLDRPPRKEVELS